MCTAPGRAPCSYSSASRTASTTTPGWATSSAAPAVSTSRMRLLVSRSRSRKLGIAGLDALGQQDEIFRTKPYSAGRHSRTVDRPTLGPMDLDALLRRRRMHRSFADRPLDPAALERILARARRAPSAGHTQGWAFLVLEGADQVAGFWEHASDPAWRRAPTWPGLLRAPVIVVPLASQDAYLARYSEADKEATGRATEAAWPVPYWLVDTAFAT